MQNMADGTLLDVRAATMEELEGDAIGLDLALERILSSSSGCNFNSFNSSI